MGSPCRNSVACFDKSTGHQIPKNSNVSSIFPSFSHPKIQQVHFPWRGPAAGRWGNSGFFCEFLSTKIRQGEDRIHCDLHWICWIFFAPKRGSNTSFGGFLDDWNHAWIDIVWGFDREQNNDIIGISPRKIGGVEDLGVRTPQSTGMTQGTIFSGKPAELGRMEVEDIDPETGWYGIIEHMIRKLSRTRWYVRQGIRDASYQFLPNRRWNPRITNS